MLNFMDPCGLFYDTTAKALSGLYAAISGTIATSNLPAGAIGSTAFKNVTSLVTSVPASPGWYFYGIRFYPAASLQAFQNIFAFLNTSTNDPQITFQTQANGTIVARLSNGNGTILGTSSLSTVLVANTWQYVEFGMLCDAAAGGIIVRINGNTVLTLSGINTKGSGNGTNIQSCQFLGANVNNFVQDVYICDGTGTYNNTFLGDNHVWAYYPDANGTYVAFTPNGAPQLYQCVNAAVPGDSTVFASDANPGDRMSVALQTTAVVGKIAAIAHVARLAKSDAGARTAAQTITNGAVDVIGPSISPGTSFAYSLQIQEIDPNTAQPWTDAGFNTVQVGMKTLT